METIVNDNEEHTESQLYQIAQAYVTDHPMHTVLDELSYPIIRHRSPELLSYISEAVLQVSEMELSLEDLTPSNTMLETLPSSKISTCLDASETRTISTGVSSLDQMLGGTGLPIGFGRVEISGKAGCGKTQLLLQLALMCGMSDMNEYCILVCTEGPPPLKRLGSLDKALCTRFGLVQGSLMQKVVLERITTADELLSWCRYRLPYLVRRLDKKVGLIGIDSIAAVYRSDFQDVITRDNHLLKTVAAIRKVLDETGAVCVCINQVAQKPEGGGANWITIPALGTGWSYCVSTRIFLERGRVRTVNGIVRTAEVTHSSVIESGKDTKIRFEIVEEGIISVG